jgi:hypothetical protein
MILMAMVPSLVVKLGKGDQCGGDQSGRIGRGRITGAAAIPALMARCLDFNSWVHV